MENQQMNYKQATPEFSRGNLKKFGIVFVAVVVAALILSSVADAFLASETGAQRVERSQRMYDSVILRKQAIKAEMAQVRYDECLAIANLASGKLLGDADLSRPLEEGEDANELRNKRDNDCDFQ